MLPFLSTSIPGNFLSKSSTTALAFVLNESAKKTKVSPLKKLDLCMRIWLLHSSFHSFQEEWCC